MRSIRYFKGILPRGHRARCLYSGRNQYSSYASGGSKGPARLQQESITKQLEQEVYNDKEVMLEEREESVLGIKRRSPRNENHGESNEERDKLHIKSDKATQRNPRRPRHAKSTADPKKKSGTKHDVNTSNRLFPRIAAQKDVKGDSRSPRPVVKARPYLSFKVGDEKFTKMGELIAQNLDYKGVQITDQQMPPELKHNLDRVLFNPGVHFLKDPRTNVYNFTPYLENIMSVKDFDFGKISTYIPSGKDTRLATIAKEKGKRYVGSTSSLTGILSHLHRLLSHNRLPHLMSASKVFRSETISFAPSQVSPTSVFLRYNKEAGVHAVDSDKTYNEDIIVSILGHLLESMLTTEPEIFETYRKASVVPSKGNGDAVEDAVEEDRPANAYHYTECGDFLMRSQLDCVDDRLPGTGVFDLKTRAVCAVRHDMDYAQIHDGSYYMINKLDGEFESFAREWFDLIRSSMFKYSLQARIGRMDGILIAYHNIKQMFGFQYVPLEDMDKIFHTSHFLKDASKSRKPQESEQLPLESLDDKMSRCASLIADSEFKLSVELMQQIFDKVISSSKLEEGSFNVVFYKAPTKLYVLVKPMNEEHINAIQSASCDKQHKIFSSANADEYDMGNDPNTIATHASNNLYWLPPDVKVFELDIRSYVNNNIIQFNDHPSLESEDDEWKIHYIMKELPVPNATRVFRSVMDPLNFPQNTNTSLPQLERLEEHLEEERRKIAVSNMNPPNSRQTHLRMLSSRSQQKILEQVNSEQQIKSLWFPKTVPQELKN